MCLYVLLIDVYLYSDITIHAYIHNEMLAHIHIYTRTCNISHDSARFVPSRADLSAGNFRRTQLPAPMPWVPPEGLGVDLQGGSWGSFDGYDLQWVKGGGHILITSDVYPI